MRKLESYIINEDRCSYSYNSSNQEIKRELIDKKSDLDKEIYEIELKLKECDSYIENIEIELKTAKSKYSLYSKGSDENNNNTYNKEEKIELKREIDKLKSQLKYEKENRRNNLLKELNIKKGEANSLKDGINNISKKVKIDDTINWFNGITTGVSSGTEAIKNISDTVSTGVDIVSKTNYGFRAIRDRKFKKDAQLLLNKVLLNEEILDWIDRRGSQTQLIRILKSLLNEDELKFLSILINAIENNVYEIKPDFHYYD